VKIVIIGCGIVGATLAYELSNIPGWTVEVLESRSHPAQEATGAALGLLMGIISQKVQGRAWQWRQEGIRYYHQLLPTLAAMGLPVLHNSQGLFKLLPDPTELAKWQSLVDKRTQQGWPLEIWTNSQILASFPWLEITNQTSAVYSPADWQVHPAALTRSLVTAAERQGVRFHWDTAVLQLTDTGAETPTGFVQADRLVITAGMGSAALTQQLANQLGQPLELMPVLGQAIHYRLRDSPQSPVITRNDVHTVPLGQGEYWVGATVEFPHGSVVTPIAASLADLQQQAIDYFPVLANAEILNTWSGLRPRPIGRPAPVIEQLSGYQQIILATGHYRNGVLLAPATARLVKELILASR
jgi:glycine oxidase